MITSIEIKNFRSIQNSNILLEPLTVIVGANSTGKSNLVKTLDFISDIVQYGINEAVYKRGGFKEILPKQYKNLNGLEIYFKFNMKIGTPNYWPKEYGFLTATYELGIEQGRSGKIKITRESLEVNSVLLLTYFLENKLNTKDNRNKIDINFSNLLEFQRSKMLITRMKSKKLKCSSNIDLTEENSGLIIDWFGVKGLLESSKEAKKLSLKNFNKLTNTLFNTVRAGIKNDELPIISLDRSIFGFNQHLRRIASELKAIYRYDLFINELRQEQLISNTSSVSVTGDNLPSVVKSFNKQERAAWKRISATMSNISPYFAKVQTASLRAGKEYLVFEEIFKGRPIESWEASDGTLRALAILLCLESHRVCPIILIEEPEHGLHPWAVKDLLNHIKETIQTKNIQIILTTHSPQVLECINHKELLITERDEKGTTYTTVDKILPDPKISMGEIGELWTRGLLKGVPTSF